ncbi:tRNA synthetases class II-domain-containing protein [Amylocystis lapponica]|nr:tRNA synthetases class II-domain-containing protein [Amylocystis lapponica]
MFSKMHAPFPSRTHTCGALTAEHADSRVVLTGWLLSERKVNKRLSFFSIRDSYGSTQLVVPASQINDVLARMRELPTESTVLVEGVVKVRPESQRRPAPAGDVEVLIDSMTLLNPADCNLPFMPSDTQNLANEELRLRYRYLDLRRTVEVAHIMRAVFHEQSFTEVETPILLKSSPEGAREFLVPTRLTSSTTGTAPTPTDAASQPLFYALPQSPQQPKQLLVASGAIDRYYQLARCFRDEDGRKDRQPEFTQVDLEMAWVGWVSSADGWRIGGREVREIVEALIRRVWSQVEGIELPERFKVMTYDEAMGRYGSDKPDLRFGLEIEDITSHLPQPVQAALSQRDEIVEALIVRKGRASDERIEIASGEDTMWLNRCPSIIEVMGASKATQDLSCHNLNTILNLDGGATLWLTRRRLKPEGGSTALGRVRLDLADIAQSNGDLTLPTDPQFLWVTEFPLFTHADADKEFLAHGRWSSSHHPFTAPMWEDIGKMYEGRIHEVRGQHYDLVLNGVEIGGGSVRVHSAPMQEYIFTEILQLDDAEKSTFNHLLHALRCGAPPHGGFAFGFDRLMSILCKTESIRDVIAFPKTGAGTDPLFRSPAPISPDVLAQYSIRAS